MPSVVGESLADAVEELTNAGLDAQVVDVDSDREPGTVTGQAPSPGTVVVEGTQVRINVSRGPKPVTVPNVIGFPYDQAAFELQRAGFGVARVEVDSDLAKGIVVGQDPDGGSNSSKGSTVTLSVSKGPVTSAVPDVTNQDVSIAKADARGAPASGRGRSSRTRTTRQATGSSSRRIRSAVRRRDRSSVVTLFVGRFTEVTETDTTTIP